MTPEPRQDLAIPLPVELQRPDGVVVLEYAVNLSPGGLCLHLREPLAVGAELSLRFTLPPSGPRVETRARVIWSEAPQGDAIGGRLHETGLRLGPLPPEAADALAAFAEQPRDRRR